MHSIAVKDSSEAPDHANLKQFCLRLTDVFRRYFQDTSYLKPPVRASDLQGYGPMLTLLKQHNFSSIYDALHTIRSNNLLNFIPSVQARETPQARVEWIITKPRRKEIVTQTEAIKIETIVPQIYFSEKETFVLAKYHSQFEKLINGSREPKTELQKRFKEVALSLIKKHPIEPKTYCQIHHLHNNYL